MAQGKIETLDFAEGMDDEEMGSGDDTIMYLLPQRWLVYMAQQ